MPNAAWQLKFVSRDTNGQPIAAVATVVKPVTPATGVAPLLAVQFAEDSLGAQCAPSHNETGSTVDYVEQLEAAEPAQGLALGWTIVVPDHEGPTSAYAAGPLAGQITLDSIRAAERFAPLGLSATTPVGMTGYSGGAIATAWAASLQKNYAPELKIVALASGGTPADVKGIVQNIDTNTVANTAFFNLILSAVVGVNRVYPTLLTPILNAQGVAAATSLENGCLGATSNGAAAPSGQVTDYTTTSDPFDAPNVVALLPKITLPLANNAPIANAFVYHSQLDELIPIAGADAMVAGWCAAGSTVEYYRGVSGDHVGFEATLSTLVYAYLASRFNGTATVVPPGSTTCN
jgi:triacylglycerol lipase